MKNVGRNTLPSVEGSILNVTLNLVILTIVYFVCAGGTAALIRAVFTRFSEEWKQMGLLQQLGDVTLELSCLVVISFWVTYAIHFWLPVLRVNPGLEHFIELYGGRIVFIYAVFLFVRDLDEKLLVIYDRITGDDARLQQLLRR
jgi:hypothetical protein